MNPLAYMKCAGRLLMALAAIASIVLMAGCGSSSGGPPTPNNTGFGDGNLKGTYVISISGMDLNTNTKEVGSFAIVGTINTDGNGNITGGTVDVNDPDNVGVFTGKNAATVTPAPASTYAIGQDGRGTGTLKTSVGSFGLDFVLTSGNHGLITRYDPTGTGSGTMDLQTSITQTSLASLAFSLAGVDSGGKPLGTVGGFTLNSSGTVNNSNSVEDFNDDGTSTGNTNLSLTGQVVLSSSPGTTGTATLTSGTTFTTSGSLNLDVWVIDSTHLKLIENDTLVSGVLLAGDAFTEQASFAAGQLVYALGGIDSTLTQPVVAGGYATTDVNGNFSNIIIEDYNDDGNVALAQHFISTGDCAPPGRCLLDWANFVTNTEQAFTFAAYPSVNGGVQLLEIDGHGLLQGAAFAQTAESFAASEGYGLNLSGANFNDGWAEVDDIAQFDTSGTVFCLNMTGILDENDLAVTPQPFDEALCGTYAPAAGGRGAISVGTPNTYLGGLNLEYYVVDASTVLFIDVDSFLDYGGQLAQLGVGVFGLQNASTDSVVGRHAISVVHPAVRSRAAKRRK
jgi:hypothetical protein